ncbi:MAG: ribulose-phosphate 3-epimerase [Solobacterium sp.]|nr:ribulose-phosphate 3-epimerase [Solobacterium sp.]
MTGRLLCPSMMCANFGHLAAEVRQLDDAGADIFHCDIMDGTFVPNFTMGVNDVKTIRKYTDRLLDCHLMIENPGSKVDWFIDAGANIIFIHPESERYVVKTLAHIKERGCFAGIAVNPDTSISTIEEIMNLCDYVLIMTVNPGFAGQGFIEFTRKKVIRLAKMKEQYGFRVMIDGHCSPDVIEDLSSVGADGFVLGTSALFGKRKPYRELMEQLRGDGA